MKKHWLPTIFSLFLLLTPAAFAGDGNPSSGLFADLLQQLVALFVGEAPEVGNFYPPHGVTADGLAGEEPELGLNYPPNG